jgi:hypothetical protein
MNTFPEKRTRDAHETTMVLPEQHPVPLTQSEAETASGGFSLTFLADLMNSATACSCTCSPL